MVKPGEGAFFFPEKSRGDGVTVGNNFSDDISANYLEQVAWRGRKHLLLK